MENDAAEILIRAHDGDCALLYIWKTCRKSSDQEAAARDLCLTLAQIRVAEEKLQRMGLSGAYTADRRVSVPFVPGRPLVPEAQTPPDVTGPGLPASPGNSADVKKTIPMPAEELPEYTSEDVEKAKLEDPMFSILQTQFQNITGRIPSKTDLQRLLGIYRYLGLSPEVIFVLFTFCLENSKSTYGTPPTMNYIERQAFHWVNRGIVTVEQAESYSEKQKELRSSKNRIKNILEIYDRKLTSNEERGIESWLEMGFEDEAIRIAYERTIEKAGKFSFPYLSRILQSWHEAGIHTVREIEEKDPSGGRGKGRKRSTGTEKPSFDPGAIDNITITKD